MSSVRHSASHGRQFRLAAIMAIAMLAGSPHGALASKAEDRCNALELQLSAALKTHSGSGARSAAAYGAKAHELCTEHRPALGLRSYMKAFKAIGVKPVLPEE